MTNSGTEGSDDTGTGQGISDDQLPEDLQPTDDNPLAQPLSESDDPKSREELDVMGGKSPEQSDDGGAGADRTDGADDSTGSDG